LGCRMKLAPPSSRLPSGLSFSTLGTRCTRSHFLFPPPPVSRAPHFKFPLSSFCRLDFYAHLVSTSHHPSSRLSPHSSLRHFIAPFFFRFVTPCLKEALLLFPISSRRFSDPPRQLFFHPAIPPPFYGTPHFSPPPSPPSRAVLLVH